MKHGSAPGMKNKDEAKRKLAEQFIRLRGRDPKLVVLSYGVGQDSTAILFKIIYDSSFRKKYVGDARFIVVTADTGNEHPETYRYLEQMKVLLRKKRIPFYFLTPDMGFHTESWQDLKSFYRRTNTVGSKAFPKTCTDNLKIKVIYRFLEHWIEENYGIPGGRKEGIKAFAEKFGKIDVNIGIAGDETKRATGNDVGPIWMQKAINKVYPLIEMDWDREAACKYIASSGHDVPLPSNCMICPFMGEAELYWLWKFYPDEYNEWVEIEQNKLNNNLDKGDKNLTVWGNLKPLPVILAQAEKKYGDWSEEKLWIYKNSHGHSNMSKY